MPLLCAACAQREAVATAAGGGGLLGAEGGGGGDLISPLAWPVVSLFDISSSSSSSEVESSEGVPSADDSQDEEVRQIS